jgi:hypothetical protein
MSKHWVRWCLVVGAGLLMWAGGGCGSGEYNKRLDKRIDELRRKSPFDEVLYDPIALGDTPVLVRVPKMCAKAWVENAEEKRDDEVKAVDPGRVKPRLDDRPADEPGGKPVREYVELPGWTLVAYETLEPLESSKVGCYWYFAVRAKDKIAAGERDPLTTLWQQVAADKYKDKARKNQVQFADVQGKPVEWKERLRCSGPMRFYYEDEEGKAGANPFRLIAGSMELYLREEGNYQILFGWRAPTELATKDWRPPTELPKNPDLPKLDMPAIAEKVGGCVALSEAGAAKPPPKSLVPPKVIAKPEPAEGEKPKPDQLVTTPKPAPKPDPTDPKEQLDLSIARLKQIGEAMQKYVRAKGRFPASAIYEGGPPLHSWRVALLPYMGPAEDELYKQFRLNEAWDSPHNIKIAEQMPEVYKTPGGPNAPSTCYLVVQGPRTVFGPQGQREAMTPNEVLDKVANTLVVVEANVDRAAPWNAPKDFELNESAPASGLGALRGDKFLGLMGDGVVRPISTKLDAAGINAICTAAGGEPVDLAKLESGEPAVPREKPLLDLAKAAFAEGRENEGLKYLMAEAVATGNEEVLGTMRWSAILKRPVLLLRWGIIVETSRATLKSTTEGSPTTPTPFVPAPVPAKPAEGEPKPDENVRFWHDNMVPELRKALQQRVGEGRFSAWLKDVPVKEPEAGAPMQRWPGIVVLTETDGNKARDLAQAEGLDLALIVDVTVKRSTRADQVLTIAELSYRDLVGDRSLWGYDKKLNDNMVENERKRGRDLIGDAVGDAMKSIDDKVRLEEFPAIQPATALKRAETLVKPATGAAKPATESNLPLLLELRFYAWKKLLTEEQLQGYYGKLLANPEEGKKLASGTEAERRAIVNRWLPQVPAK